MNAPLLPVVWLVDNRTRDLDTAALIAYHLRKRGVPCFLEPLEAFRAVLAAYRPGMIVFNHLFASHLVDWSRRLHEIGVLTALLTNEGMIHSEEARRFQSGRHHRDGHVDLILCWNELHWQAIQQERTYRNARVQTVGVPRFDFYFEPWAGIVRSHEPTFRERPRILFCTNTGSAEFKEIPREHGERHFAAWAPYQKNYGDPWERVDAQWRARQRFVEHAAVLAATGKYEIIFRPHPAESGKFYNDWLASLPREHQRHVRIDRTSSIAGLILDCDLQISEEGCTTGVESWIARKPTIGLSMYRNSPLYFDERARCHVQCQDPAQLPSLVEFVLANPTQNDLRAIRESHLAKWCANPNGHSCEQIATAIAEMMLSQKMPNWSKLKFNDYRRAAKLRCYQSLGVPYHFDLFFPIKRLAFRGRYAAREKVYRKSIRPMDVIEARRRIEKAGEVNSENLLNFRSIANQ